jgi:hypothetical protein
MHGVHNRFPAGQRRRSMQCWNVLFVHRAGTDGGFVIDADALRGHEAYTGGGPSPVVLRDIGPGYTGWREAPGHRRHDETIAECQFPQLKRLKQRFDRAL